LPRAHATSLSTRFLLIVIGVVLAPLALLGFLLNQNARQSGEQLLRLRLDDALTRIAAGAGSRWVRERSLLLLIAEDAQLQKALAPRGGFGPAELSIPALANTAAEWRADVTTMVLVAADGRRRWVLAFAPDSVTPRLEPLREDVPLPVTAADDIAVTLAVYGAGTGDTIGTLHAALRGGKLFPPSAASSVAALAQTAVLNRGSGTLLSPGVLFDPSLLERSRFPWAGEEWLTANRRLDDLPITLFAAAPLDPFIAPFADAARSGAIALAVLSVAVLVAAWLLTRRLTRSLNELATAADAVSGGDLTKRIGSRGRDEVGRVAQAFDGMAESLHHTLRQLSERQAIAAVGEFASTLAHEVRNPLGAMRLSLQSIEERMSDEPQLRAQMHQALGDVERLEATVAGALKVARSGRVVLERIDVRRPIELAMRAAMPEFDRRGAVLDPLPISVIATTVQGDGAALERLFLNLLLNAAQALDGGQRAGVRIAARERVVTVSVWDEGSGMPPAIRERVFEPFFTTKTDGTGLGLSIARQIVAAHGGELEITGDGGTGTTVNVVLMLAM